MTVEPNWEKEVAEEINKMTTLKFGEKDLHSQISQLINEARDTHGAKQTFLDLSKCFKELSLSHSDISQLPPYTFLQEFLSEKVAEVLDMEAVSGADGRALRCVQRAMHVFSWFDKPLPVFKSLNQALRGIAESATAGKREDQEKLFCLYYEVLTALALRYLTSKGAASLVEAVIIDFFCCVFGGEFGKYISETSGHGNTDCVSLWLCRKLKNYMLENDENR